MLTNALKHPIVFLKKNNLGTILLKHLRKTFAHILGWNNI